MPLMPSRNGHLNARTCVSIAHFQKEIFIESCIAIYAKRRLGALDVLLCNWMPERAQRRCEFQIGCDTQAT